MRKALILFLVFLAAISASALADNVPRYKGVIKPISSPVVMRYTSFLKSPAKIINKVFSPDGNTALNESRMSGFMEGRLVDGTILVLATLGVQL